MQSWLVDVRRGHRALHTHQPLRALHYFERALLSASTARPGPTPRRKMSEWEGSHRELLATLHNYIAVSLRKAGMRNRAVGSWVESVRLSKRGNVRRKLLRVTNEYGMARQVNEERDNQQALSRAFTGPSPSAAVCMI